MKFRVEIKRELSKRQFVYGIIAMWIVTGMLIAMVIALPDDGVFEHTMSRVAYGLLCLVTVWIGWLAWTRIREYVDIMYDAYMAKMRRGRDNEPSDYIKAVSDLRKDTAGK